MKVSLGVISIDTGTRPSSLISWNEEEEWMERLFFDMEVMRTYHEEENKIQKKAMKRR
jgi:hypothetical protein